MKSYALRLKPGQDLKEELVKFTKEKELKAGIILTCVGSLEKAQLRMANEKVSKSFEEKFEIISLVGTLSQDGVHIHICLSDKEGKAIGGHLQSGCIIYTTAEIAIGELENQQFSRVMDEQTGFKELEVK